MSDTIPAGRIIKMEVEFQVPAEATRDQIEAWAAFNVGARGSITDSPLSQYDFECMSPILLTDTGMHLHELATPAAKPGVWNVKRWRESTPFDGPSARDVISAALKDG